MGKLWFIIDPLTQMLVYYFLCVVLMRASFGNVHPLLLLTTGIVNYSIFQAIVGSATSSISKASKILLQVKIEPLIFTAISTLFAIYRVAPSWVMILLFYLYYSTAEMITPLLFLYPLLLLALIFMAWNVAIIVATLSAFFQDIGKFTTNSLIILRFLCPTIYMASFVPEKYLLIYYANPLATLFALFQSVLFGANWPPQQACVWLLVCFLILPMLAYLVYNRCHNHFTKAF